ncbi:chromate transporter [Haloimpatiens lingqiaonensis]|uniref:chromate transporter n=1 Tax=Haloimpatiens lingqiaonensis TaxID=1380675 RepID=UPI0010FEE42C|nr:chromate transporter [Haloimpatiens lingqiaonensis]
MKKLLTMYWTFFKIGAFTFGGGYAMIPLIEAEVVTRRNWISKEEFVDIIVISQSFPGALAVNCSTFIGYKLGGLMGAILALLGVIMPSFFIILVVAALFVEFRNNYIIDLIFKGIGAAVPILILVAITSLFKSVKKTYINYIIIILSIIAIAVFKVSPIWVVICSALYGIIFLRKQVE